MGNYITSQIISVVIVVVVLMLSVLIVAPLQDQAQSQTDKIGVDAADTVAVNSSTTLGPYSLTYSPLVDDTESLAIGSTTYVQTTDYTVNNDGGTFTVVNASSLYTATTSATNVNATYEYQDPIIQATFADITDATWGAISTFSIVPYVVVFIVIIGLIMGLATPRR